MRVAARFARLLSLLLVVLPWGSRASGLLPLPVLPDVPAPVYGYGLNADQPVTMSDGTVLRADVWYPTDAGGNAAAGPFPVLLQQTPYSKEVIPYSGSVGSTDVRTLVGQGYIVVISDVRGTGDSPGYDQLLAPIEATDGATMARWAAALPNSNGKVGLFGLSYMACNSYLTAAAIGKNSPVKAIFAMAAENDLYQDLMFQGGIIDAIFDYQVAGNADPIWMTVQPLYGPLLDLVAHGNTQALAMYQDAVQLSLQHLSVYPKLLLPVMSNINAGGADAYDDTFWRQRNIVNVLQQVVDNDIAVFATGGWEDVFLRGELRNYTGLQNAAAGRSVYAPMLPGQQADPRFQLLMGPWYHLGFDVTLMTNLQLQWFNYWLKGQDAPLVHTTTPLHLYVQQPNDYAFKWAPTQADQWFDTSEWPLRGGQATRYYLGPGRTGTSAISQNDGSLSTAAPTGSGSDRMEWVGLLGTRFCTKQVDQWFAGVPSFSFNQYGYRNPCVGDDYNLEGGAGTLTYTSEPFASDQLIAGPIDAAIYMQSSAADTELVATVEMVSPSGQSIPLSNGAQLGSLRAMDASRTWYAPNGEPLQPYRSFSKSVEQPVPQNTTVRYDIEVFPTAARIPAGYRLRLTLSNYDAPHLLPTPVQDLKLSGGSYSVSRNAAGGASFLNVPLLPVSALTTPCTVCAPVSSTPPKIEP
jgi:uncharacterized protein